MTGQALEVTKLSKAFGGTLALDNVDLAVAPGEIVALLGENGSGKSTLIKVLAGFHAPEPGAHLQINGQEVHLPTPAGAFRSLGLSFVHQDLGLARSLTVLENLSVPQLAAASGWSRVAFRWRQKRAAAKATVSRYGLGVDLDATIDELEPIDRAMIAIIRALEEIRCIADSGFAGVLVLDEPTAFLGDVETATLFELIALARDNGTGVILVTHSIPEVRAVADRLVVLRNGRVSGALPTAEATNDKIVQLVLGSTPPASAGRVASTTGQSGGHLPEESVLAATDFRCEGILGLDFAIRAGEIVGFAGLRGSGCERLPYMLFGASRSAVTGTLRVGSKILSAAQLSPRKAIEMGIGLVPADRTLLGGAVSMSVAENLTYLQLDDLFVRGILRGKHARLLARERASQFDIRPRDPAAMFGSLSGGNQQKVVIAKWLESQPKILLLHEPTQGVDVGARAEIYRMLRQSADSGAAIVWVTSDFVELAENCDRIYVLVRGRQVAALGGAEISTERLTREAHMTERQGLAVSDSRPRVGTW